jgi:hypothetical protein
MTWDQLEAVATEKCTQRGGFDRRLFLGFVRQADSRSLSRSRRCGAARCWHRGGAARVLVRPP